MAFEKWGKEHWKVTCEDDNFVLHAPGTRYVFNEHDFLELHSNIEMIAENLFEKEVYFVHDGNIINRETGEQLIGVIEDCWKINQLHEENKKQSDLIENLRIELNLTTKDYNIFKEIIDEADDLICSHLSRYYQNKWRNFCQNRGVDLE